MTTEEFENQLQAKLDFVFGRTNEHPLKGLKTQQLPDYVKQIVLENRTQILSLGKTNLDISPLNDKTNITGKSKIKITFTDRDDLKAHKMLYDMIKAGKCDEDFKEERQFLESLNLVPIISRRKRPNYKYKNEK